MIEINYMAIDKAIERYKDNPIFLFEFIVTSIVHEFGHYCAGKIFGFKINEFSIGFGPALFKKRS